MRLILLLALTACTVAMPMPYYTWTKDRAACKGYVWKQMPRERMPGLCMDPNGRAATDQTSCAIGCLILSPYSEVEAEWVIDRDGASIRDHELRHIKGESHVPR